MAPTTSSVVAETKVANTIKRKGAGDLKDVAAGTTTSSKRSRTALAAAGASAADSEAATAGWKGDEGAPAAGPPANTSAGQKQEATSGMRSSSSNNSSSSNWNNMLFELLHYRCVHGDMKLRSKEDPKYRKLYDWVVQQRKQFKLWNEGSSQLSSLTQKQIDVMNHIQFPWNTRGEEHWQIHFELLLKYKMQHGHTMVSRSDQDNAKLSMWVVDQRRQMKLWKEGKNTTMTKERQRLLDEQGFVWQIRNKTNWEARYQELLEYKEKTGSTVVPQHYKENRPLGKWVAKQREQYRFLKEGRHSFLTPDRLELLDQCGFVWSLKGRAPKDETPSGTTAAVSTMDHHLMAPPMTMMTGGAAASAAVAGTLIHGTAHPGQVAVAMHHGAAHPAHYPGHLPHHSATATQTQAVHQGVSVDPLDSMTTAITVVQQAEQQQQQQPAGSSSHSQQDPQQQAHPQEIGNAAALQQAAQVADEAIQQLDHASMETSSSHTI